MGQKVSSYHRKKKDPIDVDSEVNIESDDEILKTKRDVDVDIEVDTDNDEIEVDIRAAEDIITFFCTRCQTKRFLRYHCFECTSCSRDQCKVCWPDHQFWPHCARCGHFYCLSCNDYATYYNNGLYYCDHCWSVRQHNKDQGREPSDSSSQTSNGGNGSDEELDDNETV